MSEAPIRPLLRPWVSLDPEPLLHYADERGRTHRLRLGALDLAHLGLSIAEAQATLGRRDLNGAVQPARCQEAPLVTVQPSRVVERG